MKTIKKLSFAVVTFVALSFSLSSCDMLSEALSKEVEATADPIPFTVAGGLSGSAAQRINSEGKTVNIWLNKEIDITTKLKAKLVEVGLTEDKLKSMTLRSAEITILTSGIDARNLGNLVIFIDNNPIGHADIIVDSNDANKPQARTTATIYFCIHERDLSQYLSKGKIQLRIESDAPRPSVNVDMNLINTYVTKVSLL